MRVMCCPPGSGMHPYGSIQRVPGVNPGPGETAFTLIEVIVALALFAIVSVGALGILGATAAGGFLDASPTALAAGRRAKDLTAATVYLQALQDYLAAQEGAVWTAVLATWPPGATEQTYCLLPGGAPCEGRAPVLPAVLGNVPVPGSLSYQLNWITLRVTIQRWSWDCAVRRYAPGDATASGDVLLRVQTTLTWRFLGQPRTLTAAGRGLDRFVPYRPDIALPPAEACG